MLNSLRFAKLETTQLRKKRLKLIMTKLEQRSGCEKSVVKDPETGRTIWRMTNFKAHDIQPYYDINPWSPDGEKIVFSSAYPDDLVDSGKIMVTDKGHLFIMDADGSNLEWLTGNGSYNSHTGCFPVWSADGEKIIYHVKAGTCIIDISTKTKEIIEGVRVRQLSPDGTKIVCGGNEGVIIVALNTFERKTIVSMSDLIDKLPEYDEEKAHNPVAANLKWSPDGTMLILRFSFSPGEYMKSLLVFNADGSDLKRIEAASHRFHHHSWHPDGERILFGDRNEKGEPRLYFVNQDGANKQAVCEKPLGGHPCLNPDGTKIVTDGSKYGQRVILVDVATGELEQLASYTTNLKRSNAHPVWNQDGTQIMYHSDHTGTSQIYVIFNQTNTNETIGLF